MKWLSDESGADAYIDECILECTGNTFSANQRLISISPEDYSVSEGYDGEIGARSDFTVEERRELADYMIGLWQTFKEST